MLHKTSIIAKRTIILMVMMILFSGLISATYNVSTDLSVGSSIGGASVYGSTAVDSRVYFGANSGAFVVHDLDTGTNHDLSDTDTGGWASSNIVALYGIKTADGSGSKIYMGVANGKFGFYNNVTNISNDLSATDTGDWIGGSGITSLTSFGTDETSKIYIGINSGKFGVYDPVTNITTDLSATDSDDWMTTEHINSISASDSKIYIGLSYVGFGVYDPVTNITSDLSATFVDNWRGEDDIRGIVALENDVYIVSSAGKYGVYNSVTNITYDLSDTDTGNFINLSQFYGRVSGFGNYVYLGIDSGKFAVYDRTTNITSDLSATDTANWFSTNAFNNVNTVGNFTYLSLDGGKFGVYEGLTTIICAFECGGYDNCYPDIIGGYQNCTSVTSSNCNISEYTGNYSEFQTWCNYCTANVTEHIDQCNITNQINTYYILENNATCCQATGNDTDCEISENYYVGCNYCTAEIEENIGECEINPESEYQSYQRNISYNLTNYEICCALTGNETDCEISDSYWEVCGLDAITGDVVANDPVYRATDTLISVVLVIVVLLFIIVGAYHNMKGKSKGEFLK